MRLTIDKEKEAFYHFKNFKQKLEKINHIKSIKELLIEVEYLRFDINAFINSLRATTLVLQKEYRSKFGEAFNTWYSEKVKEIEAIEFLKILKELRNINQKEGNIYPTFIFKSGTAKGSISFEVDYTGDSKSAIKNIVVEFNNFGGIEISDAVADHETQLTLEDKQKVWNAAINHYKVLQQDIVELDNFILIKFKIERMDIEIEPVEFVEKCKISGELIEKIVYEARSKFDN